MAGTNGVAGMRLTRRGFIASTLALGAAVPAWSAVEPHMLAVRRLTIASPRWPAILPALRIGVIADPHVGSPGVGLDEVSDIVRLVNAERPDLIVLLGDYLVQDVVGGGFVHPDPIAERFAVLQAPLGVVGVLGNHDWLFDGAQVRRSFERAGIAMLENEALPVSLGGDRFWIGGLADDTTRRPDMAPIAARAAGEPLVLLAHDPGSFLDVPAGPALMLAGHTHGGQVRVPFVGALSTAGRAPLEWAYGHIRDAGRDIYVSAGIGTSILPIRFNAPPEVAFITLAGADVPIT